MAISTNKEISDRLIKTLVENLGAVIFKLLRVIVWCEDMVTRLKNCLLKALFLKTGK